MQVTEHANEGIHPSFETQGRRHQKFRNSGISGTTRRTPVLQKIQFKKKRVPSGVSDVLTVPGLQARQQ